MTSSLEIVRAVRQNMRRPTHQQLAQPTVLRAMSDCQRRILREAQLSDRGWMEVSALVHPATLDDPINIDNFSIPTRVEYRTGSTDDDWIPVSIVNHGDISGISGESVAFYGSPPRIAYSLFESDLVGREYRVWYETAPTALTQLTQNVAVADLFSDLLTDETTLYCLPLVENDSEEWIRWVKLQAALTSDRLVESKRQWKKWLNLSRENGVIYSDGFQGNYYSGEAAYQGADGLLRST